MLNCDQEYSFINTTMLILKLKPRLTHKAVSESREEKENYYSYFICLITIKPDVIKHAAEIKLQP
jgi:hypothetical protein